MNFKTEISLALPQTLLGELTVLPRDSLAGLRGPTSKGREGKVLREGKRRGGKGRKGNGVGERGGGGDYN